MAADYRAQSPGGPARAAIDPRAPSERRERLLPGPGDADAIVLFRRAIVEDNQAAWSSLCTRYHALVCRWLRRHPAAQLAGETDTYLVDRTFERFRQSVGPTRFGSFEGVPALLRYLMLCAHSVLLDDVRARTRQGANCAHGPEPGSSIDDGIVGQIAASELWQAICTEARNETELLVARLSFIQGLMPGEIHEQHPDWFADIVDVDRTRGNLLHRLRRNETIRRGTI